MNKLENWRRAIEGVDEAEPTSATPKPRAGEHVGKYTPCRHGIYSNRVCEICKEADPLIAERDLLRERERELVEALDQCSDMLEDAYITNEDAAKAYGITAAVKRARTLLAKHGR